MEIWKDVKGYEGIYEVSNLGNVKSVNRIIVDSNGFKRNIKQRILKHSSNRMGYLAVLLSNEGVCKTKSVHQMVAESFLNHMPDGKITVVNHINFIKSDNRLINLELVSFRKNTNRKHLKSSSEYTGVFWHKNRSKWMSSINIKGKNKYLGLFKIEYDAHLAYEVALKEILNQSEIKP